MKIYTKLVLDMTNWEVAEEESYEYEGPLAMCISFGGGGSHEESKPVRLPLWSPGQSKLFKNKLLPYLNEGMSKPANTYPRELFVPRTAEENTYFNTDTSYSPDLARQLSEALSKRSAGMMDSLNDPAFSINPEATQEFYQKSIRDPMMREWSQVTEPMLREAYAGPGYWGSARADAQYEGSQNLATELGSQYGQLMYADEQARRTALESAKAREAGFAPYALQGDVASMQAQLDQEKWGKEFAETAGKSRAELSRQIAQEEVMAGLQRYLMGEEVDGVSGAQYNPFTQMVFQALGLSPFGYGQESKGSSSETNFGFVS